MNRCPSKKYFLLKKAVTNSCQQARYVLLALWLPKKINFFLLCAVAKAEKQSPELIYVLHYMTTGTKALILQVQAGRRPVRGRAMASSLLHCSDKLPFMDVETILHMKEGHGDTSYAQNSSLQVSYSPCLQPASIFPSSTLNSMLLAEERNGRSEEPDHQLRNGRVHLADAGAVHGGRPRLLLRPERALPGGGHRREHRQGLLPVFAAA
jgi:hypothetical protein